MSEQANLKTLRCPTCGAPLKAKNSTEAITCVYCGNTVVPIAVADAAAAPQSAGPAGFSGTVRVEGIKTSSSALAYVELFFEEYDWEAFGFSQALSVPEIDQLVGSLKVSSADDRNTWFACFRAISVPYLKKLASCQSILDSVIEAYKNDNLEAYSKFDAYRRIAALISGRKKNILEDLEKIAAKALKYGASSAEFISLNSETDRIEKLAVVVPYSNIEDIPQIQAFIREKNARILEELAAKGINAEREYARARELIHRKNYAEALSILLTLEGYADSKSLIEKLDKGFRISDVMEITGNLYFFKKEYEESNILSLYPTAGGKIAEKPLIRSISKMIANYANILYYLDSSNRLKQYQLSTGLDTRILPESVDPKSIWVCGHRVFLLAKKSDEYGEDTKRNIVALELATGVVETVLENVREIKSVIGSKMVYTTVNRLKEMESGSFLRTVTSILDVDTRQVVELGTQQITVEGFVGDYAVYTKMAPNDRNRNLYIKSLTSGESEKLIEKNIFRFCAVIADKLFYYIGNSRNQTLINICCDGTQRREWPLYISDVLLEQGGWLYFIRRAGFNSILCKSRLDGSKFSIVAADMEKFIEIKNGYLYYINGNSSLVKVRMDGSNLQLLCEDVDSVLSVQEDKILFVSVDDRISVGAFEQVTTKTVKSIYAVDFSGSGKRKLAYNIKAAKKYDENTVKYIASVSVPSSTPDQVNQYIDVLYALDVNTHQAEKQLQIQHREAEQKSHGFLIAMVVMAIAFFLAFICFATETVSFGLFLLIVGIVSMIIGLCIKFSNPE